MTNVQHSKEFFELIRLIGECKSKQEEDKIILREIATLKSKMVERNVMSRKMREYVIRLIYCELLGHASDFGYIHAVNLISSNKILEKRVGYLAVSLCMDKSHQMMLLTVSRIQQDLLSQSYLEVCAGLTACCKLVNEETIPAVVGQVIKLLDHQQSLVKKKAILVLRAFHQLSRDSVNNISTHARRMLCDKDPSVMGACLYLLHDLALDDPKAQKELIPSFVSIEKQIIEHHLSRDYDYHRMPAPWIQIRLLKILAILGADDIAASEQMYEVLADVIRRADSGLNIGHAVIYECVRTITSIYPNQSLIETAAASISRFIMSDNHNLKYLGITALASIVQINPRYAAQHQMVVIDCLEDPDDTLRRKTLDLLYKMTNPQNIVVIVEKLTQFVRSTMDTYIRAEQVARIADLAERFAPSNAWYIDTMNTVFEIGAQFVRLDVIQNMLRLISEGSGEDEQEDQNLRIYCVETYYDLLKENVLPDTLIQISAWVLGEQGHNSNSISITQIVERLCDIIERRFESEETRCWVISAIMKLVAQLGSCPSYVVDIIDKYKNSRNVDLQQRCYEFSNLITTTKIMQDILPPEGSREDIVVDDELSFLEYFVQTSLSNGARRYMEPNERDLTIEKERQTQLNFQEYERPTKTTTKDFSIFTGLPNVDPVIPGSPSPTSASGSSVASAEAVLTLKIAGDTLIGAKGGPWGTSGFKANPQQPSTVPISQSPTSVSSGSVLPTSAPVWGSPTPIGERAQPSPMPSPQDPISSKKKKEASRLFGSLDGEGGQTSKATGARKTTSSGEPKKKTGTEGLRQMTSSPRPDSPEMLIDLDQNGRRSGNQSPIRGAQPSNQQGGLELLTELPASPTVQSSASARQRQAQPPQQISQQQQQQQQQPNTNNDPFNMNSVFEAIPESSPVLVPEKNTNFDSHKRLVQQISSLPPVLSTPQQLCEDKNVAVTCNKFIRNDALVFVLYIENQMSYIISNITCEFQPPPKFHVEVEGDPSPSVLRGNTVTFRALDPGKKASVLLKMTLEDIGFGTQFVGNVSYSDEKRQTQFMNFHTTFALSDLLRSHETDINTFGANWVKNTSESKQSFRSSVVTPDAYTNMVRGMNFFVVQTRGAETVACANLLNLDLTCFMHCKIAPSNTLILTVRSPNKAFSDLVERFAQKSLQQ